MRSKHLATVSLIVMGAGFLLTFFLPQSWGIILLQGGFEAGLVGGIADWFAVTALFRHPLGLRIPHTSLLLKNRDKIIQSLITALETELLNKESITQKLRDLKLFQGLNTWIFGQLRQKEVRKRLLSSGRSVIQGLPVEQAAGWIHKGIVQMAENQPLTPLLTKGVESLLEQGYEEKAFDAALEATAKWAIKPETEQWLGQFAYNKISSIQLGGMKGFAVQAFLGFVDEEKIGSMVKGMIFSGLEELANPDSTYRAKVLQEIRIQLFTLASAPEVSEQARMWLTRSLKDQAVEGFIADQLTSLKDKLLQYMDEEEQKGGPVLIKMYRYLRDQLGKQEETVNRWEQTVLSAIVQVVDRNYYRISLLVKDNLDKLDDQALVHMLEDKVGKDLQWIRVNGALCGFLIGLILTVIHMLLT